MSEKVAKQNRKIIIEYKITLTGDNQIHVNGPIDNFMLFREIMNEAEKIVIAYIKKKNIKLN